MDILYFASGTINVDENLVRYFYWKIAKLKNYKIVQPLNLDVYYNLDVLLEDCKIEKLGNV
jgi:hypothetical protein